MKTKITIIETETDTPASMSPITLMGERDLFRSNAPQFTTRPAPELPSRVKAKATGEKTRWYEVTHRDDKTLLTAG
jgi:hypothetical protein